MRIDEQTKPCSELTDDDHMSAFMAGKVRYIRKHAGPTYVAEHTDTGWVLFEGDNDVTDKHPTHVTKLMCSLLPVGTVLIGEMTVVGQGLQHVTDDVSATELMQVTSAENLSKLRRENRLKEATFFVRDVYSWGDSPTSELTYDARQALLRDVTLFGGDYIQPAEKGVGINPKNWRAVLEHFGWEAVLMYGSDARFGDPLHCHVLSIDSTELVTVIAALKTEKSRSKELVLAQRRATDGTWFFRGRVPAGAPDWKPVVRALGRSNIPTVHDAETPALDSLMRLGKGLVVELDTRVGSPDLTFKRLRKDKKPDDCVALR